MSLCKTAMLLLSLNAEEEGEPMWPFYFNSSLYNHAFYVAGINLLAPLLNHKKTKNKKEGLLHRNKTFHMSLLYSSAHADSSPTPLPVILLYGCLLCFGFWFVVVFCLLKESMQVK